VGHAVVSRGPWPALALLAASGERELRALARRVARRPPDRGATALGAGPWRAAVVVEARDDWATTLAEAEPRRTSDAPPRIGWLFPGQGVPATAGGGALAEAFEVADAAFAGAELGPADRPLAPALVQPAIVTATVATLATLETFGLDATLALGHSLGELTALYWASAFDRPALQSIARARGRAMTVEVAPGGGMATVIADSDVIADAIDGLALVVACENGERNHVLSGAQAAIEVAVARARASGARAAPLRVTGAFHSPLMRPARQAYAAALARHRLRGPRRRVISTVEGRALTAGDDVADLLERQLEQPVRFTTAAAIAAAETDLLVEVGPGRTLTALMADVAPVPCVATRSDRPTIAGLLRALAAAHLAGANLRIPPQEIGAGA
jgi:enediyne polyketide synthase